MRRKVSSIKRLITVFIIYSCIDAEIEWEGRIKPTITHLTTYIYIMAESNLYSGFPIMQFISLETGLAWRNNGSSSKFLRCALSYSLSSPISSSASSPSSLPPSSSPPSIHRLASQLFSASSLWFCYYHLPASTQFINTLHSAFPLEIYFIIIFAPVLRRRAR